MSIYRGALPAADSVSLAAHPLGTLTSPSLAAIKAEMRVRLQEALDAMDPLDREVIALRHFEQLDSAETAHVLGLSKSGASSRYIRAVIVPAGSRAAGEPPSHFPDVDAGPRSRQSGSPATSIMLDSARCVCYRRGVSAISAGVVSVLRPTNRASPVMPYQRTPFLSDHPCEVRYATQLPCGMEAHSDGGIYAD